MKSTGTRTWKERIETTSQVNHCWGGGIEMRNRVINIGFPKGAAFCLTTLASSIILHMARED